MNVNLPVIQRKEEVSKNDSYEKQKKIYDYFSTRIPRSQIETKLKIVKDERFLFLLNMVHYVVMMVIAKLYMLRYLRYQKS